MGVYCEVMDFSLLILLGMLMVYNISFRNLLRILEEFIKVGIIWFISLIKYR